MCAGSENFLGLQWQLHLGYSAAGLHVLYVVPIEPQEINRGARQRALLSVHIHRVARLAQTQGLHRDPRALQSVKKLQEGSRLLLLFAV